MTRLVVAAVGRMKSDALQAPLRDYLRKAAPFLRRLGFTALDVREVPESRKPDVAARLREEAAALQRAAGRDALLVILDERGRALTSREFAGLLADLGERPAGTVALVIGGPDGLDEELKKKAAFSLSLGPMTWPHRLARLMLAEQLYRAGTIAAGHPYHRD